jgi:hypothetical protein
VAEVVVPGGGEALLDGLCGYGRESLRIPAGAAAECLIDDVDLVALLKEI